MKLKLWEWCFIGTCIIGHALWFSGGTAALVLVWYVWAAGWLFWTIIQDGRHVADRFWNALENHESVQYHVYQDRHPDPTAPDEDFIPVITTKYRRVK